MNNILLYPIKSDSLANLHNALEIWIKFSKHLKPEEISLLKELDQIPISLVSRKNIEKYLEIKKQIDMSELLIKYKNRTCTCEEHEQVSEYLNQSLKKFVKNRLTEEELKLSNKCISKLETKQQLQEYIDANENNYEKLSICEAYTLFRAKEKKYRMNEQQLNEDIKNNQLENCNRLRKSLARDYGPSF